MITDMPTPTTKTPTKKTKPRFPYIHSFYTGGERRGQLLLVTLDSSWCSCASVCFSSTAATSSITSSLFSSSSSSPSSLSEDSPLSSSSPLLSSSSSSSPSFFALENVVPALSRLRSWANASSAPSSSSPSSPRVFAAAAPVTTASPGFPSSSSWMSKIGRE